MAVEYARVGVVEDGRLDRRPMSGSGSRMKNWSRASSLATSTASPLSRRPARPHCWRRLATVPGKPTERAQSRRPMSMPSSSASVAVTPSSSPSRAAARSPGAGRACSRRGRARGAPRARPDPLGREAVDELGRLAALGEADRAQPALDELCQGRRPRRARSPAAGAPRRAGAGSRRRSCARRGVRRRRR